MNQKICDEVTTKINQNIATEGDYIALIKEIYSPCEWAVVPCVGLFESHFAMTGDLQKSFDAVAETFTQIIRD
ncbi:MAG: hypothetical protein ACRCYP_02325 [Alphaproteobacteria bacterium]